MIESGLIGSNARMDRLIEVLEGLDHIEFWWGMTCTEVEALADVLSYHGGRGGVLAEKIIAMHAEGDEEGDLHFSAENEDKEEGA